MWKFVAKNRVKLSVALFVLVCVLAGYKIMVESEKTDEIASSKINKDINVIRPAYTPNSEKYEVREQDGGLSEQALKELRKEEAKKEALEKGMKARGEYEFKDGLGGSVAAGAPTEKNGVGALSSAMGAGAPKEKRRSLPPLFVGPKNECYEVTKPEMFSLVRDESFVTGMKDLSWWTVKNNTDRAVSVTVLQGQGSIFVAFVPSNSSLTSKLPGSPLKLSMRFAEQSCVLWTGGYASFENMPPAKGTGGNNSLKGAIFETSIDQKGKQILPSTKFLGHE